MTKKEAIRINEPPKGLPLNGLTYNPSGDARLSSDFTPTGIGAISVFVGVPREDDFLSLM